MAVLESAIARLPTSAACQGQAEREQQRGAEQHLQRAAAEHGCAHGPQALGLQLQSDDEEHQHHAELGHVQDGGRVAPQRKTHWPDHDAGHQIAEHRAQAQLHRDRHEHQRGEQEQDALGHVVAPSALGRASALRWASRCCASGAQLASRSASLTMWPACTT